MGEPGTPESDNQARSLAPRTIWSSAMNWKCPECPVFLPNNKPEKWKHRSSYQLPNYFILSCSCSCIAFWTRKTRKPQNIQLKHIVAVWCLSIKLNLQKVEPLIYQISLQTNQSKPCPSCLLQSFICLFPSLEHLEPQTLMEGTPPVSSIDSINCVMIMVTTRMNVTALPLAV